MFTFDALAQVGKTIRPVEKIVFVNSAYANGYVYFCF